MLYTGLLSLAYCGESRSVPFKMWRYKRQAWLLDKIYDYTAENMECLSFVKYGWWALPQLRVQPRWHSGKQNVSQLEVCRAGASAVAVMMLQSLLYPVTRYIHTLLPWNSNASNPWLWAVGHRMLTNIRPKIRLFGWPLCLCQWPEKIKSGLAH